MNSSFKPLISGHEAEREDMAPGLKERASKSRPFSCCVEGARWVTQSSQVKGGFMGWGVLPLLFLSLFLLPHHSTIREVPTWDALGPHVVPEAWPQPTARTEAEVRICILFWCFLWLYLPSSNGVFKAVILIVLKNEIYGLKGMATNLI